MRGASLEQAGIPVVQTMELTAATRSTSISACPSVGAGYARGPIPRSSLATAGSACVAARLDAARAAAPGRLSTEAMRGSRHRPGGPGGQLDAARLDRGAWRRAVPATCWQRAGRRSTFSAATTTSRSARCSNVSARGIRVPEDLVDPRLQRSRVLAASAYPALSSVATPRFEMGRQAAETILQVIRAPKQRPAETRIDPLPHQRAREHPADARLQQEPRKKMAAAGS